MRNVIRGALIIILLVIVIFINLNEENSIWDLIYWMKDYVIISVLIYVLWIAFSDIVIRLITVPIGFYYLFELISDIFKIVDADRHQQMYSTTVLNHILGYSLAISIIVGYVISKRKVINKYLEGKYVILAGFTGKNWNKIKEYSNKIKAYAHKRISNS